MRIYKRIISVSLSLLLFTSSIFAAKNFQTVKVGYYENEIFQEGASKGLVKTGYAYEYYQKISEYTGWKYEYIYASYVDLYRMLEEGKIDLLAGLAKTEEREKIIGYPELPMGNESFTLLKHNTDDEITSDYSTLNNKKIGILDSAMVPILNKFLAQHNIDAMVRTYPDYATLYEAFNKNRIDVFVAEGDGTYRRDYAEVICEIGKSDYYLCVNIQRDDLLKQLNTAQKLLNKEEPTFINSLNTKYFPLSVTSRIFTDIEKEWISSHTVLNVGYLKNYLPYSDMDDNGEVTGIVKDLFPEMFERLGISNIKVVFTAYSSYSKMISAVSLGDVDVIFPVGGGLYYSEENGIYQSNVVGTSPTELVYNSNYDEKNQKIFAVNKNNTMQYYYILTNFPEAQIIFYDSIEECLNAVLKGKVTCTTVNGLRNELLKNRKYRHLKVRQLTANDNRCFGVEIGNEGLLKLLNRGVNVIGSDYAQNLSYYYAKRLYSYTLTDFIIDNIVPFTIIVLLFVGFIFFILLNDTKRSKKALDVAKRADTAKAIFLKNMSHDLKTPVNSIIEITELAKIDINDKNKIKEYLDKISVNTEHLSLLVNGSKEISENGDNKNIPEVNNNENVSDADKFDNVVNIKTVVEDIKTILFQNLQDKKQELVINVDNVIHKYVVIKKLRINQMLINILTDAINNTPENGIIYLNIIEKPFNQFKGFKNQNINFEEYATYDVYIKQDDIGLSFEISCKFCDETKIQGITN